MTDDLVNWVRHLFRRPELPGKGGFIPYQPHLFADRRKQSTAIIVHTMGPPDEQTKQAMIEFMSKQMGGGDDA